MANKNKLTMKMIENDVKSYDEVVEIDFDERDESGEMKTYTIELYPFFDPLRINKVLESIRTDLIDMSKSKKLNPLPDELVPLFILHHIILEFTNIPKSQSAKIERRVAYFNQLIKSKYFKMVDEYLVQEEVNKVFDVVFKVLQENEKLQRMANKLQADIQNLDLKSPELRERIQGKRIPEA